MKKNKVLLLGILALALLLGGAYILYARLSQEVAADQLLVQGGSPPPASVSPEHPPASATPEQPPASASPEPPPASAGLEPPPASASPELPPASASPELPPASASPELPPASASPEPPPASASPEQPPASASPEQPPEDTGEEDRVAAPDFTVYDRDGNEVHLSDFVGKPVVLNFWASWCGPCKREMPGFNDAYAELGEEIHFLMVNLTTSSWESFEDATALIDETGYSFPVFYDLDGDAAVTYRIYSIPVTCFIDAEGYIVAQATGAIDRDTLQRGIDMIAEP